MTAVTLTYFSDVLCVWAYFAQLRIAEIRRNFGDGVIIEQKFCSVFGDTARKVKSAWGDKGGYQGFNAHLRHSAESFPEVTLSPELWISVRPASSMAPHLTLKAVQLLEAAGLSPEGSSGAAIWKMREAFFGAGRNIADWSVQCDVLSASGISPSDVERLIHDGRAFAALASDYQDAEVLKIQGSPTFVLNEGRQKLYGNVGYRIIEANIQELLRTPHPDQASWC
jgi:predicted DsbA family dithiol-disulfide isomerase